MYDNLNVRLCNICLITSHVALFVQLLLSGIHNCPEYIQNNANGIINDVTTELTKAIQGLCGCGFNHDHISNSFVQCFSESPQQITFRAKLNQTSQSSTVDLVLYIEQWITNLGSLVVQGTLLQLNSTCPLVIADQFVASECPLPLTMVQPTTETTAPPVNSQSDNTGAIVGGVVALVLGLALIIAVVIIVYHVLKLCRMGNV